MHETTRFVDIMAWRGPGNPCSFLFPNQVPSVDDDHLSSSRDSVYNNHHEQEDEIQQHLDEQHLRRATSQRHGAFNSRQKSALEKHGEYYAIDVEAYDEGVWWSIAFVKARYPDGTILSTQSFFVQREGKILAPKTEEFWANNHHAFEYNKSCAMGISESMAELDVCMYVEKLRQSNEKHFFLLSDNPVFDIGFLDAILTRRGLPPISMRSDTMYAQVLCVWTYKLTLAKQFATKSNVLFAHPHVRQLLTPDYMQYTSQRPVCRATKYDFDVFEEQTNRRVIEKNANIRHTAKFDCCEILTRFFQCLDLVEAMHMFFVNMFGPVSHNPSARGRRVPISTSSSAPYVSFTGSFSSSHRESSKALASSSSSCAPLSSSCAPLSSSSASLPASYLMHHPYRLE